MNILKKYLRPSIATLLLAISVSPAALAQRVSVKSNALYWAAATPNLGCEFRINRHITLSIEGAFNKVNISKIDSRITGIMPEARYWFSARPQAGHFLGLMALYGDYNFGLKDTRHHGNAVGFGPTYGYSFVLGRRWSLETTIGIGALHIKEKKYRLGIDQNPTSANHSRWLPAPLKAGITFVYIIK